jgi:hypothetical protein
MLRLAIERIGSELSNVSKGQIAVGLRWQSDVFSQVI